jgi:4-amino-4-deoxy-L-arabinose transferase-like glycosyltransferase
MLSASHSTRIQTATNPGLASRRERVEGLTVGALFLGLTAVLAFRWSSARLMDNDEYLSYYTDRVPTLARVVWVQLHYPVSLDPPAYHLLSHLAMQLLGPTEMALRLPAFLGFLLCQVSLFFFVRRIAGQRPAAIALAVPLLTYSLFYAVQGRPYGLLLGLYSASLACWQAASRAPAGRPRLPALVGLAAALVLGVTSHYFGVLILIPVCAGELARSVSRRRLDRGVLAAIAAGFLSVATVLPFQHALLAYRAHYYRTTVDWHIVPQSYFSLFCSYRAWSLLHQHVFEFSMVLLSAVLVAAILMRLRVRSGRDPAHEWIALLALVLLPVFAFLFGRFVTHTMEPRYAIAALFVFAAGAVIVCEKALRTTAVFYSVAGLAFAAGIVFNLGRIYTQALDNFYIDTSYDPDAQLRSRFCLVYAQQQELGWLGHDTNYVTAVNMQHFAPLCTISYADFLAEPDPLVLDYHSSWEWLGKDLAARKYPAAAIGSALRGDLIQLRNAPATDSSSGTHIIANE